MAKKKAPPQEQVFLDDIIANPGDDTPRLVFADWLQDHGQDHRAEFIRLQCQLAKMDEDDPQREDLEERLWELLVVYRYEWRGLPKWVGQWNDGDFRRGFTEWASLTATEFRKQAHMVFAKAPIRELQLRAVIGQLCAISESPFVQRVSGLDLCRNDLSDDDLSSLIASPHLGGLTSLDLSSCGLTGPRVATLATWPQLRQLTRLELRSNDLRSDAIASLVQSKKLTTLKHLNLSHNPLLDFIPHSLLTGGRLAALETLAIQAITLSEGVATLTRTGVLPRLTSLDVGVHSLDKVGYERLGKSDLLGQLKSLSLYAGGVSAECLRLLLRPGRTTRLHRLDLSFNQALETPEAMEAIASAPLHSLRWLDLRGTNLQADGLRILASTPCLTGLHSLRLSGQPLNNDCVKALIESPSLTNLTQLALEVTSIGPSGAAQLATWPGLVNVRRLTLDGPVEAAGVAAIAASPYLGNLTHLDLSNTHSGNEGARALATATNLSNLRSLALVSYPLPDEAALRDLANSPRLPRLLVLKVRKVSPPDTPDELLELGREIVL